MTTEEAIAAFKTQAPVVSRNVGFDIEYLKISALIYRLNDEGKMQLTLELLDKCKHSVTITNPSMVKLKED